MHTDRTLVYTGWIIGLIVVAGCLVGPGCQKRVVRQTYAPMTGLNMDHPYHQPGYQAGSASTPSRPAKKNVIDNTFSAVGNLLFGWTRHLAPKPEPARNVYRSSGPFPYTTPAEGNDTNNP